MKMKCDLKTVARGFKPWAKEWWRRNHESSWFIYVTVMVSGLAAVNAITLAFLGVGILPLVIIGYLELAAGALFLLYMAFNWAKNAVVKMCEYGRKNDQD